MRGSASGEDGREDDEHPGLGEPWVGGAGRNAEVTEIAVMPPVCRNMPRRPAIAAAWSGASDMDALFDAGVAVPMPTPLTAAAAASHRYGETPPAGPDARPSIPTMTMT